MTLREIGFLTVDNCVFPRAGQFFCNHFNHLQIIINKWDVVVVEPAQESRMDVRATEDAVPADVTG